MSNRIQLFLEDKLSLILRKLPNARPIPDLYELASEKGETSRAQVQDAHWRLRKTHETRTWGHRVRNRLKNHPKSIVGLSLKLGEKSADWGWEALEVDWSPVHPRTKHAVQLKPPRNRTRPYEPHKRHEWGRDRRGWWPHAGNFLSVVWQGWCREWVLFVWL